MRHFDHPSRYSTTDVAKQLVSPGNGMRREDHVVQLAEAMRLGHRFFGKAIERRASDSPGFQRIEKGVFMNDAAAGGVQEVRGRLHLSQLTLADEPSRLGVQWTMQ